MSRRTRRPCATTCLDSRGDPLCRESLGFSRGALKWRRWRGRVRLEEWARRSEPATLLARTGSALGRLNRDSRRTVARLAEFLAAHAGTDEGGYAVSRGQQATRLRLLTGSTGAQRLRTSRRACPSFGDPQQVRRAPTWFGWKT